MAASASDVRSILSIPEPSSTPGPSQPRKQAVPPTRKPEGISRELYSLIGPSAPSLATQLAKPRLKQKPNLGGGGRVKWEFRTFKNGARLDGLELRHWVKASTAHDAEYPFVKYNTQMTKYTYSQDDYTRFLEDKDWTKEETDYLFALVQEYEARWFVIYDRYEWTREPPRERELEELKDRYYSVCRKLVRNRSWPGDDTSKALLISSFQFDKEREVTRKKYLKSLLSRTPEQLVEEEALYIELKRLEQNERQFKKDREELLRTIAGIDSGLPDVIEDEGISSLAIDVKKKKKGSGMDIDSPMTPVPPPITPVVKRPQTAKSAAYDTANCIIRTDPPTTVPVTKAAHQPAYLRSFKLPVPKAAIAPKITAALAELGISHSRLVMPTRDNSVRLESLLDATTALVETKRLVDKVDYDIQVLKSRLGMRESQGAEGDGGATGGDGMEVDEGGEAAEAIGEDGRALSVVSTRSARSRKHTRRSMSISSVDTSGTVSTRAGTKRQKRS